MRVRDGQADYGWVSIGLHWLGAAVVLSMLFVGDSIHAPDAATRAASMPGSSASTAATSCS